MARSTRSRPAINLAFGTTLLWLSLVVLIPLAGLFLKTASISWSEFVDTVTSDRAIAAYQLSFGAALIAAIVNGFFGLLIAWVLVRYSFPGHRLLDSLIDFPFALPTAVAGLTYSDLYVSRGWIGRWLTPLGINAAFSRLAVVVVLVFISLPFVIRTLQPILESVEPEVEEAAASLGATRWQSFRMVVLPTLLPAWVTGFALAFARAVGEYGSVIFVSGNMPFRTEIAPVLITMQLEQFAYGKATAIAVVLLVASFSILIVLNLLERWSARNV
jgi:sulfate transport system permease protein